MGTALAEEDALTDAPRVGREHRGGGPGVLIGLGALVVVVVIAFVLFSQSRTEASSRPEPATAAKNA